MFSLEEHQVISAAVPITDSAGATVDDGFATLPDRAPACSLLSFAIGFRAVRKLGWLRLGVTPIRSREERHGC